MGNLSFMQKLKTLIVGQWVPQAKGAVWLLMDGSHFPPTLKVITRDTYTLEKEKHGSQISNVLNCSMQLALPRLQSCIQLLNKHIRQGGC